VTGSITGTSSTIRSRRGLDLAAAGHRAGQRDRGLGVLGHPSTALDSYGNTATGYTGIVHFTGGGTSPTLPANYTFVGADNGVHTFTNGVTLTQAGNRSITATDTVTGTITGTSGTIVVAPLSATSLAVSAPANATAGTAFSITVTALDTYGNTATGLHRHRSLHRRRHQPTLPSDYTFVGGDNGTHTFTNGVILLQAGSRTITATDNATAINGTSSTIAVAPTATVAAAGGRPGEHHRRIRRLGHGHRKPTNTGTPQPVTPEPSTSPAAAPARRSRPTTRSSRATTARTPSPAASSYARQATAPSPPRDTVTGSINGTSNTMAVGGGNHLAAPGRRARQCNPQARPSRSPSRLMTQYGIQTPATPAPFHFTGGGTSPTPSLRLHVRRRRQRRSCLHERRPR